MKEPTVFEKYPLSTVFVSNLVTLLNYAIGLYLLYRINIIFAGFFLVYLLAVEIFTYREGCVSCWYYSKRCASGRGKIAPLLFKRDDPKRFCEKQVTWKNLMPQILVTVIPMVAGIYLLIQGFSWTILILTLTPILVWFLGNPIIFGKLACPHCKQGRICCPANEFFGKKVEKK